MGGFWAELKRRNVVKVGIAYCAAGWLAIQVASVLFPMFGAPAWILKVVTTLVILGLPLALVFAWAFELTPQGLKRSEDVRPDVSTTRNTGRALNFLIIGVLAIWMMARFVGSAFGATLQGARDQPRRMSALGYDVWMIRWVTFIYAGFWGAVSGLMFVYYHKYIHPVSLSLANSAEGLLAVIAGGSGTLAGPIVGAAIVLLLKNWASAYIERWNMLLGFVFVFIVIFMPEGVVPGVKRLWRRFVSKA